MHACMRGHISVVKALLDKGADINAKDKDGKTALWYASTWHWSGVVAALKRAGAKP